MTVLMSWRFGVVTSDAGAARAVVAKARRMALLNFMFVEDESQEQIGGIPKSYHGRKKK